MKKFYRGEKTKSGRGNSGEIVTAHRGGGEKKKKLMVRGKKSGEVKLVREELEIVRRGGTSYKARDC